MPNTGVQHMAVYGSKVMVQDTADVVCHNAIWTCSNIEYHVRSNIASEVSLRQLLQTAPACNHFLG